MELSDYRSSWVEAVWKVLHYRYFLQYSGIGIHDCLAMSIFRRLQAGVAGT